MLSRTDALAAGRALGLAMPPWVRSAADVPGLHWPWTSAIGAGLLTIDGKRVKPGPLPASWDAVGGEQLLGCWLLAFARVLATVFPDDGDGAQSLEIGRLALTVLATDPAPTGPDLNDAIRHAILYSDPRLYQTFDYGHGTREPAEVALDLLTAFGAVTAGGAQHRITPLGRWAVQQIGVRVRDLLNHAPDAQAIGPTCQLKITLRHVRPPCWRRIQLPSSATLGDLHMIIQVAFDWDDDHLHAFTIGRRQYGDPYFDAEYDEQDITLAEVFAHTRKPITYTYDFGDDWRHDIVLEQVTDADPDIPYSVCVAGRGDAPTEDTQDDWITFDRPVINTRLAGLAQHDPHVDQLLSDDIETILTDAYGDAEELTAFLTVLEEEIDFPVPAMLLGNPIVVTGMTADDATGELRVCSKPQQHRGTVAFADLEFPVGTVEAWLHAAYLTYLGRPTPTPTRPATWTGLSRWVTP
ncbi:MAG: plasmid pRiA4b ORF-3 family protein [Actinophytocola sp.]|nr:plasmid pRiA4b ORF-3 family protein [Actinophytocola sp.]